MGHKSTPSETWCWSDLDSTAVDTYCITFMESTFYSKRRRATNPHEYKHFTAGDISAIFFFFMDNVRCLALGWASCGNSSKTNRGITKGEGDCMLYLWPGYYLCIIHFICMFFTPVQKLKININPVYYRAEHCMKNIKKWSLTQIKDGNVYWPFSLCNEFE